MSVNFSDKKSGIYQAAIAVVGTGLWILAATQIYRFSAPDEQIAMLVLALLIIFVGLFQHNFPLPLGLKVTSEKIAFTPSDAIILLVACWYGVLPAVFIAGIEGFITSRFAVQRLTSNLFSAGMMSLAAGAAALSFGATLHYVFYETSGAIDDAGFFATSVALLVASIVHIAANWALLSTLLALRHNDSVLRRFVKNFLWAAPMFLPNGAAASFINLALHHGIPTMLVIGGTVTAALYLWHRQSSNSVRERTDILQKAHRETIEALAVAINAKDEVTHEHVLRVQIYAAGIARIVGCTDLEIEALKAGALLHDIGKIAVPDYILNKPGKLTAAEFDQMKLHTVVGAQIIGRVEFPYPVVPIVRHHHERWDGKGYPDGLKGEQIPLIARILSVVDCFDAVREDRQYRRGMTREAAINLLMEGSGTQYDPRVVGTFVSHLSEFEAEIQAARDVPVSTFGLEPFEELSERARQVSPAAGLAESAEPNDESCDLKLSPSELQSFYDIARAVSDSRHRREALTVFTEKLNSLVPYDSCAITLVRPETRDSSVVYAAGEHAALLQNRRIARGEGVTGWVIDNGKPFYNTDPKLDLSSVLAEQFASYRTLAVFPIIQGGEVLGAIALYSSALAEYTSKHQQLLRQAVVTIASTIANVSETDVKETSPGQSEAASDSPAMKVGEGSIMKMPGGALESELMH